jgi:hypothetical protein
VQKGGDEGTVDRLARHRLLGRVVTHPRRMAADEWSGELDVGRRGAALGNRGLP